MFILNLKLSGTQNLLSIPNIEGKYIMTLCEIKTTMYGYRL